MAIRPQRPRASSLEVVEPDGTEELEPNENDEPTHYPPENALPDAPLHVRAGVSEPEEAAEAPFVPVESVEADAASAFPETPESVEISEHLAGEEEDEPAVASLLDDDEDRDIQAMILGDVEGTGDHVLRRRRDSSGRGTSRVRQAASSANAEAAFRIGYRVTAEARTFARVARRGEP